MASQSSNARKRIERYLHIEGAIKQFPEALQLHANWYNTKEFVRSLWQDFPWQSQNLNRYYDGRRTKFVLERDGQFHELVAGRFRCPISGSQIIVVGIPDEAAEEGLRYVIVCLPWGRKDYFKIPINGTELWKGSAWNIWKSPKDQDHTYYEGVPETILRVKRQVSRAEDKEIDFFVPARLPAPSKTPRAHKSKKRVKPVEQQPAHPTVDSTATVRSRCPSESESERSQSHKKARSETEKQEEPTLAQSAFIAPDTAEDREEPKDLHVGSNGSLSDSPLIAQEEEDVPQTAKDEAQGARSADAQNNEEIYHSASEGAGHNLPEPPADDKAQNGDYTTTTRVQVKQESTDINSLSTLLSTPSTRESLSAVVSSGLQSGKVRSMSVPIHFLSDNEASTEISTPTIHTTHQTSVIDVIDLTDNHDHEASREVSTPQVNVSFTDEHGEEQHVVNFDECNTAESMFVEACAWDIADKETKMLEITIPGCKPARIGKSNEKHFAQKVFKPLKDIVSRLGQGQSVTLTVRKYM